ncbi:MAG: sigma-70 family RNA polymerase sigma factor [Anaerolineae bacterium]|nr:sigma-70 family RNA polymerase sigma factor [Anaerolineae bacterium]
MRQRDSEQAVLLACRRGETNAFAQLVHAYQDVALRTAYLMTNDQQAAEDIAQNAFLAAFRNIHRFDLTRPFRPWFLAILVNEARMYLRAQRRQPADDLDPSLPTDQDSPLLQVIQADDRARVREALAHLDEPFRTAAVLYYFNNLSVDEIATSTGSQPGTVKSRLHTARQRLREALTPLFNLNAKSAPPLRPLTPKWKWNDDNP